MQNKKGGFRVTKQEMPKEQVEYDEASKNLKVATTKMRLAQQGIDTSSISRQDLDRIMSLFDKMDVISTDVRNKTSEIQRDANAEIQKMNQKANEKYSQVSKDIDNIVNKIKKVENVAEKSSEPVQVQQAEIKEEIRESISPEKIKEDMINYFTDRIMQKVRTTFEDFANLPQFKTGMVPQEKVETVPQEKVETVPQEKVETVPQEKVETVPQEKVETVPQVTIGNGVKISDEVQEVLVNEAEKMAEESMKMKPGDRPDDKDIPVITPEMMQKTQDDIDKRRN